MYNKKKHKNITSESTKEREISKTTSNNNTNKNDCNIEPTDEKDFSDELDSATFVSITQLLW